jgi:lipopolysaccharide/colanic/teichoic acid biosynthesis glycosyltransferase
MSDVQLKVVKIIKKSKISDNQLVGVKYVEKRVLELVVLFILAPFALLISFYTIYRIKKESKGAIFFTQSRVGLNGKKFTCYKFRSMHENSEFNPYTQDDDKRIFPFGNFMRKTRIDELPQFWNILKGDMHLIGPRAEWDILSDDYGLKIPNYKQRHLVRPGITGLAQVYYPYGRNIYDAKNKLQYDRLYINRWTIGLELKIIWKTVAVVLGKRGM